MTRDISRAMLLASLITQAACVQNPPATEDDMRIVFGCTAGMFQAVGVDVNAETELRKRLKAGADVHQTVRGYIFEVLPESQRLEAYKLYLDCYDKQKKAQLPYHPRLSKYVAQSEDLWHVYSEANQLKANIPVGRSDDFALMGAAFQSMSEADFKQKDKLIRSDRQATMYFIASEIIIRSNDRSVELTSRALQRSRTAHQAASLTRNLYDEMLAKGATPEEVKWAQDKNIGLLSWHRLAEIEAQLVYLVSEPSIRRRLEDTLSRLPCDYIRTYQLRADPMFTRIPTPARIQDCG